MHVLTQGRGSLDSFSTSAEGKAKAAVQKALSNVEKSGKPIFGAKYNVIHNIVAWRWQSTNNNIWVHYNKDHSKFAFTNNFVCFRGNNRQVTQLIRGGEMLCFRSTNLRSMLFGSVLVEQQKDKTSAPSIDLRYVFPKNSEVWNKIGEDRILPDEGLLQLLNKKIVKYRSQITDNKYTKYNNLLACRTQYCWQVVLCPKLIPVFTN
ncbi:hypothetical protein PROFUN_09960 [Planoprotostelium fungivorum]|uniref:Uncharacterized protein n=1 Tax=Planoprotostelium fungivorum TaxID=1890364 RepID=A0A2P6NFH7_9EUKA|nr:hypothetical protein PROFUN_09960 [Planoprotostelium fungivorum]